MATHPPIPGARALMTTPRAAGGRTPSRSVSQLSSSGSGPLSFDPDEDEDVFGDEEAEGVEQMRENIACSCLLLSNLPRHGSHGHHNDPTKDWLDVTTLEQDSVLTFNRNNEQQDAAADAQQQQQQQQQDADGGGPGTPAAASPGPAGGGRAPQTKRHFRSIEDLHCVPGHRTSLCRYVQIEGVGEPRSGGDSIPVVVNGRKVRYRGDGSFNVRIDGELYGPFYRVRISPYTFAPEQGGSNIKFPVAGCME